VTSAVVAYSTGVLITVVKSFIVSSATLLWSFHFLVSFYHFQMILITWAQFYKNLLWHVSNFEFGFKKPWILVPKVTCLLYS